jgi:hypothetical protein
MPVNIVSFLDIEGFFIFFDLKNVNLYKVENLKK